MKLKKIFQSIFKVNLRTLYFNFKQLPFKQAIKLPIWISNNCRIKSTSGEIFLDMPLKHITTGLIQIGYGDVGIFDKYNSKSILEIKGNVIFKGKTRIGHGCKLSISRSGKLYLGENFMISAESSIVCHNLIHIDRDVLVSWDVLIMDTDLHKVSKLNSVNVGVSKPIYIGEHCWIGCRSLILKGIELPNNTIIAANSTVSANCTKKENTIWGSQKTNVIKEDISWEL